MGTLIALLTFGAGLGGLGWWITRRDGDARPPNARQPLALPPPSSQLLDLEEPVLEPVGPPLPQPPPQPNAPPYVPPNEPPAPRPIEVPAPRAIAPSDFVQRVRSWLEQGPPATQIELVAVQLERAGHRATATQLRVLAHERRHPRAAREEQAPADPRDPTSPLVPAGSSVLSPESGLGNSQNTGGSNGARTELSAPNENAPPENAQPPSNGVSESELRDLARRVAAMLHARQGQPTDRRLVRQFQVAARVFPARGDQPSGLYGPATRDALARHGVRNPPRPRFRAELEAAPPRAQNSPRPNAPPVQNAPPPQAPPPEPQRPNAPPPNRAPNARPSAPRPRARRPRPPQANARPNPNPNNADPGEPQ